MNKILVACFSASGRTKKVGVRLAKAVDADFYEIKPKEPYARADLNFMNKKSRSSLEMSDQASRPVLADRDANIDQYNIVFLGFPIWWYDAPRIILTFLENYDFSGKKIILFATSGGSGFGNTAANLTESVSDTTEIVEGKLCNGLQTTKSLKNWADRFL